MKANVAISAMGTPMATQNATRTLRKISRTRTTTSEALQRVLGQHADALVDDLGADVERLDRQRRRQRGAEVAPLSSIDCMDLSVSPATARWTFSMTVWLPSRK